MKRLLLASLLLSSSLFAAAGKPIGATFFQGKQISTPAAPASGYNDLYWKSDDHLYTQNHSGTETRLDFTWQQLYGPYKAAFFREGSYITSPVTFNPGTGDFGVTFWLYPSGSTNTSQDVLTKADNSAPSCGANGCGVVRYNANGKIGVGSYPGSFPNELESGLALATKDWTFVALTRQSGTLSIYLNGAFSSSTSSSTNYEFTNGSGTAIGASPADGAVGYLDGMVEELQLYSGALSAGYIASLYAAGAGVYGTGSETNLVAGFHLNGDAQDYGPGSYHGSWTGAANYGYGRIHGATTYLTIPNPQIVMLPSLCGALGSTGCIQLFYNNQYYYTPVW